MLLIQNLKIKKNSIYVKKNTELHFFITQLNLFFRIFRNLVTQKSLFRFFLM